MNVTLTTRWTPALAAALAVCALALAWPTACRAQAQTNRLRKVNISQEGDHLYLKLTGDSRFRYRVKAEDKPPRLTVQLYGTESDLGYSELDVNKGYVKDFSVQELTVSGQKATFIIVHLSQSVEMDYGLSGDGRTFYLATPMYAGAKSVGKSQQFQVDSTDTSIIPPGSMPPEIVVPENAPSVSPASTMIPYPGGATGDSRPGSFMDFPQDVGIDNSPYIAGPVILQDADISKVVQLLSEAAGGASIIVESKVLEESSASIAQSGAGGGGGITMTLSYITLEDALDVITSANDWAWMKIANSYVIMSRETANQGVDPITAATVYDLATPKLTVTVYRPKNVDACSLTNAVSSVVPDVACDPDLNYLLLKGREEDMIRAKQILGQLDRTRDSSDLPVIKDLAERVLNESAQYLVTKVIRLEYIRATALGGQLNSLMDNPYFGNLNVITNSTTRTVVDRTLTGNDKNMNMLTVDESTNTLVFVGQEEVYRRLETVIKQLDVPYSATVVRTITLRNAFADDLKKEISNNLVSKLGRYDNTEIMYNSLDNSITFVGTQDDYERFQTIVQQLDNEQKAMLTESVPFVNINVLVLIETKMLDSILGSPYYGYAEVINGKSANKDTLNGHTRISVHAPTNAFVVTAQRRYIDRVKQFLLSMDQEQTKLVTKVVKIKNMNAQRVALALEQLLKLEDPDSNTSDQDSEAPFLGNFYTTCGLPWRWEVKEDKYEYVYEVCEKNSRLLIKTSPTQTGSYARSHFLSIYVESAQNALFLRGTEKDIRMVEDIVKRVDTAQPQVRIDVQIVSVSRADLKDFRKEFNLMDGQFSLSNENADPKGTTSILFDTLDSVDSISNFKSFITALVSSERATVLANPSIVARENAWTQIAFVQQIPYSEASGNVFIAGTEDVKELKINRTANVGPQLWLIPHINLEDNTVFLHMAPFASTLVRFTAAGSPITDVSFMVQEFFVRNGETIIASGMINSQDVENQSRVPILGDLPVVGNLFRSKTHSTEEREVIFLLTPTILPVL